jgi:serine/threonine protein kinase
VVFAYAPGEATLEDYLLDSKRFPQNIESALGLPPGSRDDGDESKAKRVNKIAKMVMRDLLGTTAALHSIGVVHRDLKPANLVLMNRKFKIVDFGAACDLRSGANYDPQQGLLDPNYSPPEQFVMPSATPRAPPFVAPFLAPFLWTLTQPQLFDSYSCGLVLLQLTIPQLRSRNVMAPNGAFQQRLADAEYDLQRWRSDITNCNLNWDFTALDVNNGLAWDLACRLVTKRNLLRRGRWSASAALGHPFIILP